MIRQMGLRLASQSKAIREIGWLALPLLVLVGVVFSVLLALQPLYAGGLVVAIAGTYVFIRHFEQAVLGILLMRSVLDMYSAQQIPALFAIGVDGLVFLYLGRQWILRRQVHTDPFWWFLFGWVMVQSTWVLLLAANGLGGTPDMAFEAMREWTRFFSLAMVYLLVMQLRDRISPARLATFLLLAAAIPLALALLQALPVDLPSFLQSNVTWTAYESEGSRINSTLGHYNSFATFSLLFMALALWRAQIARKPWGWLLLGAGLLYCLLLSKSLTGIVMLIVFCAVYFLPRLRGKGLLGAIAITIAIAFLLSTDLAQSRLLELNQTPLLNPDLSISRAMALQAADMDEFRNSFNWRLLQWRNLLMDWQQHPLLGYGMASA
ncbi:MAG: O-antigen ligase family protein, partial [Cyanobacteria bacterium J06607_10]